MSTFDIVVVGCGGGPSETNLSSYLFKSCDQEWKDGIIAVEAGSGVGALTRIMAENPSIFSNGPTEAKRAGKGRQPAKTLTATEVHSYISGFLVTHAHLDHVSGLILSAGATSGVRKRIWATDETLKDLESGVFSDRVWPNLASWAADDEPFKLRYSALPLNDYHALGSGISVCTMPISHGRNAAGSYDSAAFFLRHDASRTEALFWGDVEPDTLALHPRNAGVWRAAAPKIVAGALRAVFIECSWPAGRVDALLFGHLSPPHLVQELRVLADAVAAARAEAPLEPLRSGAAGLLTRKRKREAAPKGVLASVRVFVIHCKDDLEGQFAAPIQHVIADQVRMLVDEAGLGCEVVAVEQGTRISI